MGEEGKWKDEEVKLAIEERVAWGWSGALISMQVMVG
jgi:hypothetical protein